MKTDIKFSVIETTEMRFPYFGAKTISGHATLEEAQKVYHEMSEKYKGKRSFNILNLNSYATKIAELAKFKAYKSKGGAE
jgi:hypothetical protein